MKKKTTNYYINREKNAIKESMKSDQEIMNELSLLYNRQIRAINSQIDRWLVNYAFDNEISVKDVRKRVNELDIEEYSKKAKEYVKNKDLSKKANEEMSIYNLTMKVSRLEYLAESIKLEVAKLGTKEEEIVKSHLESEAVRTLKKQASILGDTLPSQKVLNENARKIVNGTFKNANFSDRIWANKRELQKQIEIGVERTVLRGESPRKWVKDLKTNLTDLGKRSKNAALRLAVTESSIVSINANRMSLIQNGFTKGIIVVEPGACEICKKHDDKIVDLTTAEMGKELPIWHPWCRCSVAAYVEDEEENIVEDEEKGYNINYKVADEKIEKELQKRSEKVWNKKLLYSEQNAIYEYSGKLHGIVNRYLGNRLQEGDDIDIEFYQLPKMIKEIDRALSRNKLGEDLILHRGVSREEYQNWLIGDTLKEYKSSSISDNIYNTFGNGYRIRIHAQKNTKGFYIGNYSQYKSEKEFLIHRGQKYRILKNENGIMEVEILE